MARRKPASRGERPGRSGPSLGADTIAVNGHSAQWLAQGFPWVYPNEVAGGAVAPGGRVVRIQGPRGEPLGQGVTDPGWIAVRRFREDDGPLDAAWMAGMVDRAVRLRERVVLSEHTTAARLIHGENDGLPGIRVDWWDGYLVVVLDTPSVYALVPLLLDALSARLAVKGAYLCYRPDPRDTQDVDRFFPAPGWILGEPPPGGELPILENGLVMLVRPGEGPDVGSYMDMREVRAWLAPHLAGRTVLNTFAYTAAFSVDAARWGATEVVSVDLSRPYLERAEANAEANGLPAERFTWVVDDTFKALDRFRRTGQPFDVVILDPPSFSHGPTGTWSAKKDTPRLVASAARITAQDGWLVVASNQGQVSPRAFRTAVAEGLRKAGRTAREIAFFGAAPDFPAAPTFPEAHYLKVGVWVLDA